MRTFLVAGESLVDIVVPSDGGPRHNAVGGSCLNVAVGLARLDVPTTLVTRIGDDELGALVVEHVRASEVVLAEGSVVPGGTTMNIAVALPGSMSSSCVAPGTSGEVWTAPVSAAARLGGGAP